MKSILIVTDVDFWQRGSGNRIRIAALLRYLSENFAISVIYTGDIKPPTSYPHAAILPIGKANAKSSKYCINLIRTLFKKISFKVCIIEYIHQSYFLNYLPPGTLTILDTHDIQSEKNKSFNAFN
ncbi:hypothetical protein, partial [Chitinophaga sp.]|uniref:hypothetical protein n=1 Tax=Chitinophaga sp. TaxID=1869181 RepID=UPI002CFABEDB